MQPEPPPRSVLDKFGLLQVVNQIRFSKIVQLGSGAGPDFRENNPVQNLTHLVEPTGSGIITKSVQVPSWTGPDFSLNPPHQSNPNSVEPLPVA